MAANLLLAIESSTRVGGVTLADGPRLLASRPLSAERRRASEILPTIAELLRAAGVTPNDVAVLCYSAGPGSFTGLRVAATVTSLWQMSTAAAVVAVPTIEVVAQNAFRAEPPPAYAAILMESKPGFAYAGFASIDGPVPWTGIPAVVRPDEWLPSLPRPFAVLGEGLRHFRPLCEQLGLPVLDEALWPPRVEDVAALGWRMFQAGRVCAPHEITPLYIRPPECEEVYDQRRAAAREKRGE